MQFYQFFDPKMSVEDIDDQAYKDYVLHLKSIPDNDGIDKALRGMI